jgi:hypothetical protein
MIHWNSNKGYVQTRSTSLGRQAHHGRGPAKARHVVATQWLVIFAHPCTPLLLQTGIASKTAVKNEKGTPKGAFPFESISKSSSGRDELYRVTKGLDRFCSVVRNLNSKLFFESHYQFYGIKAVSAKIVDERRGLGDFFSFDAKMLDDDLLYTISDVAHVNSS